MTNLAAAVTRSVPDQTSERSAGADVSPFAWSVLLDAVPFALVVLDPGDLIISANHAGEQLLGAGRTLLQGKPLSDYIAGDSPVFALIGEARNGSIAVAEPDLALSGPKLQAAHVAIDAAPIAEQPGHVVLVVKDRSIERRLNRQSLSRDASRSAKAMAAMLAHEVKNPLSGIRGAAQLLEKRVETDGRILTQLICDETDRIVGLVNRMEMLSDERPAPMSPVNIHEVLNHVRRLATAGFARHVGFREDYDPSLPPVWGNRDQLIQVFLNLVKNAAEACPEHGGSIVMATQFVPGLRLGDRFSGPRPRLALTVRIQDNGAGIPSHIRDGLFDPFVTGRVGGKGLGLALAAKIIAEHDGVIEFESQPRRTVFSISLPLADAEPADEPESKAPDAIATSKINVGTRS
ncbi:two-component system sensor histidine kinase NtrB [Dongia sedimenti]|uniref:histidine kinase n=1 Tax=Dongia sedimenti TaxID=3064282 RepID=A0ABU0YJX3_9PROT|nr:ATP-binding protein [Rhodospirillaceae bacterium R-7]